jgi:hypothetical protein
MEPNMAICMSALDGPKILFKDFTGGYSEGVGC